MDPTARWKNSSTTAAGAAVVQETIHLAYGTVPFEDLQVDFTEMPKCGGHKHLLVLVCTYSGWVEAFPTRTEKAHEVWTAIAHQIRQWTSICGRFSPENSNGLGYHLDTVHSLLTSELQKSGKNDLDHQKQLGKVCQETRLEWVHALPLGLFKIRGTPFRKNRIFPYEVLYHRPPPLLWALLGTPPEWGEIELGC
ncbi:Gag-Pol polyprotein [Plecturocebus cupreus]